MSHIAIHPDSDRHAQYARDGVIHVPALLTTDEIAEIRDTFMTQVETDRTFGFDDLVPDDDPLARYPRFVQPHRRLDSAVGRLARRWLLDPRIVEVVTELVGTPLAAQSMFYFKPPFARGQAMHQDNLFLQSHPETCIAAWIAVDDCDAENGGLKLVPGSHRYEVVCPDEADMTKSFANVEVSIPDGLAVVQSQLKAGDALFFHGSLVHGSEPNTSSDRFRRSLIFHYVPEASVEVAKFYQPLLTRDGAEVMIDESVDGGPCGEGWEISEGH